MAAMTTATATATTTAAAPKADRWARRYVAGLEASSSSPSSPSLSSPSPSLSPGKKGRLGFGVVPQSIARDLKTSNSSNVASAASGPIVQSPDGTLAKVYGTLLEPQEAREQQWRCAGCHASFHRDATLYLAPRRAGAGGGSVSKAGTGSGPGPGARAEAATAAPGEAFCRPCYEKRFALGRCPGCDGVVLGSTKEQGTFVKTSEGNLWHGKCWATCAHCGQVAVATAANDIVEGILDGLPTCMACFDDGPRRVQSKTSTKTKTTPAARDTAARSATIAEMTAKFRGPAPAAAAGASITAARPPMERRGSSSGSGSKSHQRPASPSKPRPLTAQFSGSSFNLGRFRPSSSSSSSISSADTGLARSDSRGRSIVRDNRTASQQLLNKEQKQEHEHEHACHRCGKGPFDEQEGTTTTTHTEAGTAQCSTMLALSGGTLFFHPACFCCAVCQRPIPGTGTASFASLGEQRYAHHGCAPRPVVAARPRLLDDARRRHGDEATTASDRTALEATATARTATARPAHDHVTLQRPTVAHSRDTSPAPLLPASYLGSSSSDRSVSSASSSCSSSAVPFASSSSSSVSSSVPSSTSSSAAPSSNRRFQSTAGAAPPTRSTLLSSRPSPLTGNVIKASLAMSSNGSNTPKSPLARLGAMPTCGGCARSLTSLEAVPGPRGSSWHPKCLVCTAPSSTLAAGQGRRNGSAICGKRLASAAKVDTEGRVRCRGCFDRENARHRV